MANRFEEYGKKYGTMVAVAVALLVWLLPTPEGMNITQHKLLSIFSGAVVLWITLSVSVATSSFIIVSLLYFWWAMQKEPSKTAFLCIMPGFRCLAFPLLPCGCSLRALSFPLP